MRCFQERKTNESRETEESKERGKKKKKTADYTSNENQKQEYLKGWYTPAQQNPILYERKAVWRNCERQREMTEMCDRSHCGRREV